ncbi:MAG: hypothetical protein M3155_09420 [Actinomycetota bacterium]|nr:hypothetical protein [Actinomycetota bacterium]
MTGGARWLRVGVLVGAVALAGCGGGTQHRAAATKTAPRRDSPPPGARSADPGAVRVIRAWVDAERRSDMARAARYFDLPAVVANGGPPLVLRTRAAVRLWNSGLPCGAQLIEAVALRGYVIARFRLTRRPGQRCDGTGQTASTAFKLRHGRIAQWVRVDDAHPYQGAPQRPVPGGGGGAVAA